MSIYTKLPELNITLPPIAIPVSYTHLMQGDLFSRPVALADFERLVNQPEPPQL